MFLSSLLLRIFIAEYRTLTKCVETALPFKETGSEYFPFSFPDTLTYRKVIGIGTIITIVKVRLTLRVCSP